MGKVYGPQKETFIQLLQRNPTQCIKEEKEAENEMKMANQPRGNWNTTFPNLMVFIKFLQRIYYQLYIVDAKLQSIECEMFVNYDSNNPLFIHQIYKGTQRDETINVCVL